MNLAELCPDWRTTLDQAAESLAPRLTAFRRHLHRHPEPSLHEFRTTAFIAQSLAEAGIPYRIAPTQRGVIAGPRVEGPVVAIRADIDALRIHDQKPVEYRSTVPGVMHACGHDAHTAMGLGAALLIAEIERSIGRTLPWRAVFQPAEEAGDGAKEMIDAGALDDVASIVALHVDPERPVGEAGWRYGPLTAHCVDFSIEITGRGGHAARPHLAIDPILIGAQLVSALYAQVPRSVDSREPAVLTFGAFNSGDQSNVIPESAELRGTLRTFARAVADGVEARVRALAQGLATATSSHIACRFEHGPTAVINDPAVTDAVVLEAGQILGPPNVRVIPLPSLGGEDFAAYLERNTPGCMIRLGIATPGVAPWPGLHSACFDLDERALILGARILARSALALSCRD